MHGYSSSEESDDPKRPSSTHPHSSSKDDSQKKRKKRAPPQKFVNRIWKGLQTRKPSAVLAVLPFDPVEPSATSYRANESLQAGYERAAEECRRKVRKIVQDCKRVNTRYRDIGWDLDWDLKMGRGDCLNGLQNKPFSLRTSSLNTSVPQAVKRVHEIFEKPKFLKNISGDEIVQGRIGDCWLMATMSSLANVEGAIERICVEYNTKIGVYGFVFYRDGEWIHSIIDDKLYLSARSWDTISIQRELLRNIEADDNGEKVYRKTYQTGSKALFFGKCKDPNETWVPLLEKAYAKAHNDYSSLNGGWIGQGVEDLTGGVTTEFLVSDILDEDEFWENELSKANKEFMFGLSTGLLDSGYGERDGITESHAYSVMATKTLKSGERLVKLRNPWGVKRQGLWTGKFSDGSKEWNQPDVQTELDHKFGSDSVFWIPYEDMLQKFQHLDRTRLFRDSLDWRCCQRWIGIDVLWKPQYNEKFHMRLTRDSPVVLVLNQLDHTYFEGLEGQYRFRLQFRVHEAGRPGAEDYIVRSKGSYLMVRSQAVEVPDLPAGDYTIFVSVSAQRNLSATSVEDVVKSECQSRQENEKLIQVGHSYDLAHSKAAAHMAEVARQRQEKDRDQASGKRKTERRKVWERRHLNREAAKMQAKKNKEKNEKRRAAKAEEKRKKKEEEEQMNGTVTAMDKTAQTGKCVCQVDGNKKEEAKKEGAKDEKVETDRDKKSKDDDKHIDDKEKAKTSQPNKNDEKKPDEQAEQTEQAEQAEKKPDESTTVVDESNAKDTSMPSEDAIKTEEVVEAPSTNEPEDKSPKPGSETAEQEKPKLAEDKNESDEQKSEETKDKSDEQENGKMQSEQNNEETKSVPVAPQFKTEQTSENIPDKTKKATDTSEAKKNGDSDSSGSESSTEKSEKVEKSARPTGCKCGGGSSSSGKGGKKKNTADDSDADSSDSPVSDYEDCYSDDDFVRKPRPGPPPSVPSRDRYEPVYSDEDALAQPWNAVCVVGFRAYSKDENLELRVVMEGGRLDQDGMGAKGAPDLDDAQENAGGEREVKEAKEGTNEGVNELVAAAAAAAADNEKAPDEESRAVDHVQQDAVAGDGMAHYPIIVSKKEDGTIDDAVETKTEVEEKSEDEKDKDKKGDADEEEHEDSKDGNDSKDGSKKRDVEDDCDEKSVGSSEFDMISAPGTPESSADSTPAPTPAPTPLQENNEFS